mmetsp:Transcript_6783/g.18962  ORF Transcript_6783/g.18962 Transcript_6783/m.18962 type:complete len:81 (-) Transcript_6783:125-367(-)
MSQARLSSRSSRGNAGARRRDRNIFDYTQPWVDASGQSELDTTLKVEEAKWAIALKHWVGTHSTNASGSLPSSRSAMMGR